MAILTDFIDFIVPIKTIEEKYPGGWEQCLKDHDSLIGGRVWFDAYLFRDGAMSPSNMELIVNRWTSMGFECTGNVNGKKFWKDACVFEGMYGGSTLDCDWLEIYKNERGIPIGVSLKGAPICELAGPNNVDD